MAHRLLALTLSFCHPGLQHVAQDAEGSCVVPLMISLSPLNNAVVRA